MQLPGLFRILYQAIGILITFANKNRIHMKYFEFTFNTNPCTETVNDVLAAVLGEAGFESFVECE